MSARQERLREALADSDIFGSLTEEEIERLAAYAATVQVAAGQVIFQKGDSGDSIAVVVSGRVKISALSPDGREAVFTFIEPGRCFGEVALLDGKARSADATAVEASELFILKRADLLGFLERHPEIALRIIGVLCARLRRSTEMVEDAVLRNMAPRIARALLRLAGDYGVSCADGVRIDFKLSQRELGSYVGLARENINRQLGLWRQEGLVSLVQGRIVLHDMERLRFVAENG
ncbi:Crp/Fnr family transcriptional regulator [Marinimicrococcus flavescens]|uniref:Crp/Fnr family transcriptional regulator n=1 Tax=Marinimicrococcus flavescens TaxID=3031815 RepID=A0AAP3XQK0_9PROT|nr:Crp/Fnr family transcriptional regulator [Marinimicrococcus flavescens]